MLHDKSCATSFDRSLNRNLSRSLKSSAFFFGASLENIAVPRRDVVHCREMDAATVDRTTSDQWDAAGLRSTIFFQTLRSH